MKTLLFILLFSQVSTPDFLGPNNAGHNTNAEQESRLPAQGEQSGEWGFFAPEQGASYCPMCGASGYNNYAACNACGYGNGQALGTGNSPLGGGIAIVLLLCFTYFLFLHVIKRKRS